MSETCDVAPMAAREHDEPNGGDRGCFRRTATRADLLDGVVARCKGLSRTETRAVFEMTLDEVAEALARGEPVKLRSFGLFNVRAKRERIGRNPRTGIEVPITPRRVLTFRPSPVLLEEVNRGARPPRSAH